MSRASIVGLTIALAALGGSLRPTTADDAVGVRRLVVLGVHDTAGYRSVVTVAIGQSASITRPGLPTLVLSPRVAEDGTLHLAASLVWGSETPVPLGIAEDTALGPGGTGRVELGPYVLDVVWLEDRTVTGLIAADADVHQCCVVCEGITTCACRVQAPCGSCCDAECGGCAQSDSASQGGKGQ
jgi:hypothetical protein